MTESVAIAVLVATLATGVIVGLLYLQRNRRPRLVTLHLALSLVGLCLVAFVTVKHAGHATGGPPRLLPLVLLAVAVAAGWSAKRFARGARRRGEAVLALHLVSGAAGFFVLLAFARAIQGTP